MEPSFWPTDFATWLELLVLMVAIMAAVAGFVWRVVKVPIDKQFEDLYGRLETKDKTHGERIGNIEASCSRHDSALSDLKNRMQAQEFRQLELTKENGRIEGVLERLEVSIRQNRDTHGQLDVQIRERLASIEGKMDIFNDLGHVLRQIVQQPRRD